MLSRLTSLQRNVQRTLRDNPELDRASVASEDVNFGNETRRLFSGEPSGDDEHDGISEFGNLLSGSIPDLEEAFKIEKKKEKLCVSLLNTNKTENDGTMRWRNGPAPIGEYTSSEIKLTTLTGIHEENIQNEDGTLNESTISLLNYFAYLGTTSGYSKIDYDFIESVILQADINVKDEDGQSLFHEIARDWNVDIAYFMKQYGAKIDEVDHYGRTPLIVASAANHTEMVEWLLDNGADINHKTNEGEGQNAIHYAAKYGAIRVFRLLVTKGISPLLKDSRGRTPFFMAAYNGQEELCKVMLDMELPTACHSNNGTATIDLIIRNLPNKLGERALDQFVTVNSINRTEYYYISCMEKVKWLRLNRPLVNYNVQNPEASTIHEILVEMEDLELIQHPVVEQLLSLKYDHYGKFIISNIAVTIFFTLVWTITSITGNHGSIGELLSIPATLVFSTIGFLLTLYFIYQLFLRYKVGRATFKNQRQYVAQEINRERKACHPKWKFEKLFLQKQLELSENLKNRFWRDGWNIVELLCLVMSIIEYVAVVLEVILHEYDIKEVQKTATDYYTAFYVIVLWLRLNRCLRPLTAIGPFIAMLGQCVKATAQIGFLYFEFYIPLSAAIWVTFGGERIGFEDSNYKTIGDMFYQIYLMSIIGDYDSDTLLAEDSTFAEIYIFLVLFMLGVVTLNLYIALLSEVVTRVIGEAIANTQLMQAKELLFYEKTKPRLKSKFEKYISKHCAPLVKTYRCRSNQDGLEQLVRKLNKNKEHVSNNLKDYLDQISETTKHVEHTNKSVAFFQHKYSTQGTMKMKSNLKNAAVVAAAE